MPLLFCNDNRNVNILSNLFGNVFPRLYMNWSAWEHLLIGFTVNMYFIEFTCSRRVTPTKARDQERHCRKFECWARLRLFVTWPVKQGGGVMLPLRCIWILISRALRPVPPGAAAERTLPRKGVCGPSEEALKILILQCKFILNVNM